jgi:predicted nucleic acid-binding protein
MRILLDTCALAELRDPRGHPAVREVVALVPEDNIYLSVLTIAEISQGTSLLRDGRKKRNLSAWLSSLASQFADRILPLDHETAHLWGEASARCAARSVTLPMREGLLAATALHHGLHIVTRSTPSLAATGALIVDPWKESEQELN